MTQEYLRIGIIGKPKGLKGQVFIFPTTDTAEQRFTSGAKVLLASGFQDLAAAKTVEIQEAKAVGNSWLIIFTGYQDRSKAETLRGLEIFIRADETELAPDEYYDYQLAGRKVLNHDGSEVGKILEIQHFPASDMLIILTNSGHKAMVPFVRELVPEVGRDYLKLADVEGLLAP